MLPTLPYGGRSRIAAAFRLALLDGAAVTQAACLVRSFHDHEVRKERSAQKLEVCFKIKTRQKKKCVTLLSPRRDRLTHSLSLSGPQIRALHFWPARQHSPPQPLRHPRVRGRNKNCLSYISERGAKVRQLTRLSRLIRRAVSVSVTATATATCNRCGLRRRKSQMMREKTTMRGSPWYAPPRPRRCNVRAPTCHAVANG